MRYNHYRLRGRYINRDQRKHDESGVEPRQYRPQDGVRPHPGPGPSARCLSDGSCRVREPVRAGGTAAVDPGQSRSSH